MESEASGSRVCYVCENAFNEQTAPSADQSTRLIAVAAAKLKSKQDKASLCGNPGLVEKGRRSPFAALMLKEASGGTIASGRKVLPTRLVPGIVFLISDAP